MPKQTPEHRLGKAILEELAKLPGQLVVNADGTIALNNPTNYVLTRNALLDAASSAGALSLAIGLIALLPPELSEAKA